MKDIKAALDAQPHPKPYAPAEINYGHDPMHMGGEPGAPSTGEVEQGRDFRLFTAELERAHANGMMVWDATPQVRTIPGSYVKTIEVPGLTFNLLSPPHPAPRKIAIPAADMWNLFYWDMADKPAAPVVRDYFAAH